MEPLFVLAVWYGLGAVGATWPVNRGHDVGVWTFAGAMLGAFVLITAVFARIWVRVRPCSAPPLMNAALRAAGAPRLVAVIHESDTLEPILAEVSRLAPNGAEVQVQLLVAEEARLSFVGPDVGARLDAISASLETLGSHFATSAILVSESSFSQQGGRTCDLALISRRVPTRVLGGRRSTQLERWRVRLGAPALGMCQLSDL